jgi:hypothetical protein
MSDRKTSEDLLKYSLRLEEAVDRSIAGWVVRSVLFRLPGADSTVRARAIEAGEHARVEIGGAVRALLALDVDEQPTTPLTLLRRAVRYPTEVLRAAGVPPVERDEFAQRNFPDDVYDLTPATFADVDESLREPGLEWGAAKAHVHLSRRRGQ